MARRGIMKSNMTNEAPTRLPTDICGTPPREEFIATDISLSDVRMPKTKKAILKAVL